MARRYPGGFITATFKPLDPHGDNYKLWNWGLGTSFGMMGDNTLTDRSSPVQLGALTTWANITASYHVLATKTDGTMWSWGRGDKGQLGSNAILNRSSPVQLGIDTNWSLISNTLYNSTAIKTTGTLWAWGDNTNGGIGDGTRVGRSSPVQIGALTNWYAATVGGLTQTIALKTNGSLWSWGVNTDGNLGLNDVIPRSSPVQIGTTVSVAETFWSQTSVIDSHTLAIETDGTMWAWGLNTDGQLGQNNVIRRSSPVQIGGLSTWSKVAAGNIFSGAIKTDGTLWTFGYNTQGQLGQGDRIPRSSPVQVGALTTWYDISFGRKYAMATKTDGTLWTFGYNSVGQLGQNDRVDRSSPVQVGALTTWSKIFTGWSLNSLAIKTDGTLWGWGYNADGQLGQNDVVGRSSPVQIGSDINWATASTASVSSAIKTDGTLWTWGYNADGQLGQNDRVYRSSPVQVGALTTWSKVSINSPNTVAVKTDGTLWAWGTSSRGGLGLNDSSVARSSPVQVGTLNTWSKISAAPDITQAIETDGTLYSWGYNVNGELGLNDRDNRSSPVQVGVPIYGWSKITTASDGIAAIKGDGTLWTWGKGTNGLLGDNTILSRSSPVQIGALTTWSSVNNGGYGYNMTAIKTDGTIWTWGQNLNGSLGDNTVISRSSPIQVGALTTWSLIASNHYHVIAAKTDRTLWSWGKADSGQLGNSSLISRSSPVQIGTASDSGSSWYKLAPGIAFTAAIESVPF